jgi:hypothetical protein
MKRERESSVSSDALRISRRTCLHGTALASVAMALLQVPSLRGWIGAAHAATGGVVEETLGALASFIVPGTDPYSVQQGVQMPEPGGVEAGAIQPLRVTLDAAVPFVPSFSSTVAAILNDLAAQVHPGIAGPFTSAFANVSFHEKAVVFSILESIEPLKALAGVLPAVTAFLSYSEVGVFDPATRTLSGRPVGWTLTGYEGVADGRDAFKGYFENRRATRS